jgi:hypothetical protein
MRNVDLEGANSFMPFAETSEYLSVTLISGLTLWPRAIRIRVIKFQCLNHRKEKVPVDDLTETFRQALR